MTGKSKPRLLFYFLHLLGVGHVYRAKRLIEGFARQGIEVDVIYGGEPIDETFEAASVHYLPPIRATDASYKVYLDSDGQELGDVYLAKRQKRLLDHFSTLNPDIILIEAFPFGRRMIRHEIKALLTTARERTKPPLIVSSVRDILQERKKPGRSEESRDWIQNWFDHILVHSDPEIIALGASFPLAAEIEEKLFYTGFVVPDLASTENVPQFDIIVSVGGGGFGSDLLQTALETARMSHFSDLKWCFSTGPHMPAEAIDQLHSNVPENASIVDRLDNLAAHLSRAKISISQCGYNTAMDVLRVHEETECRAVFVPYDTQGQSEQLRRAELLHEAGYAINLPQSQLTAERLEQAIHDATKLSKVSHTVDFDGVKNSARLVHSWLNDRKAP